MDASLKLIRKHFRRLRYKIIQYKPYKQSRIIGREIYIVKALILKKNVAIFRSSVFYFIYNCAFRVLYPKLYILYRLFFKCEQIYINKLLTIFKKTELDTMLCDGIISSNGIYCSAKYRFVPVENLLLISSPNNLVDTEKYVHVGNDTIIFLDRLKGMYVNKEIDDALEIGCGAGLLTLWISRYAKNVVSTDINKLALRYTNQGFRL